MNEHAVHTNPFAADPATEATDRELLAGALEGSQEAIEALVARHRPWIYNLALRMVMVPQDAEDVTQEVLVKVLTRLASYDPDRGAFRTWLYRIVANHVINMKTRGYEAHITTLDAYYSFVTQVPDQAPASDPETLRVAADLATSCVMGTLLCLERRQRLAFILAVGFGVTDVAGGEILDLSPTAFRKTLSRARAKLLEHMRGNCGLVSESAPCRCRKKAPVFVTSGALSADRLVYLREEGPRMGELAGPGIERLGEEIGGDLVALFGQQPFYEAPDVGAWLQELVERRGLAADGGGVVAN